MSLILAAALAAFTFALGVTVGVLMEGLVYASARRRIKQDLRAALGPRH